MKSESGAAGATAVTANPHDRTGMPPPLIVKLMVIGGLTLCLGVILVLILTLVQDRIAHAGDRPPWPAIDDYRMVERAVKYGIGLILSTYGVLFFLEALGRARVHTMHYAVVGLAMAMFYLLLLSIFEHTGFLVAYLLASGLVIGLNAFYLSGNVGQGWPAAARVAGALTALYAVSYAVLSQGHYALLIGSLTGFLLLAAFMAVTRRIDWDRLGAGPAGESG